VKTNLSSKALEAIAARLRPANAALAREYPGESGRRQPVHTLYGGAQLFRSDSAARLGRIASAVLEEWAPDAGAMAAALSPRLSAKLADAIYPRVVEKLRREPVEDMRIDFEDGYGNRPHAEEDGHAVSAARELASGLAAGTLPPFIGIRIKPLNDEFFTRALRTLDLFLTALVEAAGGRIPENFVVTIPKVTVPEQVGALADALDGLERALGLPAGAAPIEIMVETTQAMIAPNGQSNLLAMVRAARGRCRGAHFGTYDYTAACGITAAYQSMEHPACDFARRWIQVALGGTGMWLSDGATNIMPIASKAGAAEGNRSLMYNAWRLHFDHIRSSLASGFYQGWDLHPAQLPTRYAALYSFFLEGLDSAGERLRNFVAKAAQATLVGDVFDDAATGQGLLNYFLRAINCGALSEADALERTGLTKEDLSTASFARILERRRA
jgi:citrate lyase beta subunit